MRAVLEVSIRGTERRYPVPDGIRMTVGRTKECEIYLEDQAVSRRHCTIEARGVDLIITDLESANGTFVNDRLVRSSSAHSGDAIRVGSSFIDVSAADTGRLLRGLAERAANAARTPLDSALSSGDDLTMESIVRKRFEPARFDWLSSTTPTGEFEAPDRGLLQRAQRHLSMLHRVSEVLASTRDLDDLADATLGAILDVTGGDRAAFVLRRQDRATGGAEVAAARARVPSLERFTVSRTLVADVIDKGISTFAYDAVNDERFSAGQSVIGQQVRSVMCVPLRTSDDILGALYVDSVSEAGRFSEADLELLAALGNQAGVALHRVRLMGEIERLLIDTIRAIASTIDAKDGYTHRHSERVAAIARRIALEIGMTADEQHTVQLAALLHDVGKIAVPDSILNKAGTLTPEEFDEMKQHPLHGARILANIQSPVVTAVLPGVQYHHERWDGTGYPEGLRGDQIPLIGRVLGAADFFDAVTSARPYRAAIAQDEAIAMIEAAAGVHFDPRIVDAVVRLHARGELLPSTWEETIAVGEALLAAERPERA